MTISNLTLLGNPIEKWLLALLLFIGVTFILLVVKRLLERRLAAPAQREGLDTFDLLYELVKRTSLLFILAISAYGSSALLSIPNNVLDIIHLIFFITFLIQVGFWGIGLIDYLIRRQVEERLDSDPGSATTINVLGLVGKIGLWIIVLLLILDNIPGVEINTLIASLGVGGIAVALAVQNILGDLFASLSIGLDKPFAIGDFIIIDDFLGTVEYIGLKSTRVRSLSGEQLVFSNSDLLNSRIRNYKRMDRRRVLFTIGVVYQTPADKLESIPKIVREVIDNYDGVTFDRCHFKEYGTFSLIFETVFWVESPDYNAYMDIREAVNLTIYRRFSMAEIEFAYPTQTLFVEK